MYIYNIDPAPSLSQEEYERKRDAAAAADACIYIYTYIHTYILVYIHILPTPYLTSARPSFFYRRRSTRASAMPPNPMPKIYLSRSCHAIDDKKLRMLYVDVGGCIELRLHPVYSCSLSPG